MATCPQCGNSSRANPGSMVVTETLVARPPGSFSLAGSTFKVSANLRLQLRCKECDWSIVGHIEGDEFVADREQS